MHQGGLADSRSPQYVYMVDTVSVVQLDRLGIPLKSINTENNILVIVKNKLRGWGVSW